MKVMNPCDLSKLDPDTISFITLKDGNMIMLNPSVRPKPEIEKRKIDFESKLEKIKYPFHISEKIIISFVNKKNIENNLKKVNNNNKNDINNKNIVTIKNDFNTISKIIKNINFSLYSKKKEYLDNNNINNKENISRNKSQKSTKDKIINISNTIKKTSNYELTKSSNNYFISTNSNKIINKNIDNYEENKEEISLNDKICKKNYIKNIDKIFDVNKPTINAVISLDIPSDITYEITGIQKQYNMLRTQLKRKKNRHKKLKGGENYQRYYELYKNPQHKVYNGTFDNKLKYLQEKTNINNDNINKNDKNYFNKYNHKTFSIFNKNNNVFNILNYKTLSNKNLNKINLFSRNEISDYNSKNNSVNHFLNDKTKSVSERNSFKDKVTRNNSALIFPCNDYKNSIIRNNFF